MNLFKKRKQAEKKLDVNHQFFFVEVPVHIVAPQAMLWGESEWWPKANSMRFIRDGEPGEVQEGMQYCQVIAKPIPKKWKVEVSQVVSNRLVRRLFKNGMFKGGYEIVRIEERANGTRIDYEMHYSIKGLLNKVLWTLIYQRQYEKNVEMALSALKEYVIQEYQQQQDHLFENGAGSVSVEEPG
ncbi:MAG: hypothetical protein KAJ18_10985 [Candidatus Omnitrophica bacterium]|nr:hypothetical protein [Candidatus Omnitrophota bacterium]